MASFSSEYLLEKCLFLLVKKGWRHFRLADVTAEYPDIDFYTLLRLYPEKECVITAFLQKSAQKILHILKKRDAHCGQDIFIEGILTTMEILEPFSPVMQEILCHTSLSLSSILQWIHPLYHSFYTFSLFHTPLSKNQSILLSLFMIYGVLFSFVYRINHTEEDTWAHINTLSQAVNFIQTPYHRDYPKSGK